MRRYDLGEEGSGASDVIRYDAGKVAEFIADMEACMSSYNTKASVPSSDSCPTHHITFHTVS